MKNLKPGFNRFTSGCVNGLVMCLFITFLGLNPGNSFALFKMVKESHAVLVDEPAFYIYHPVSGGFYFQSSHIDVKWKKVLCNGFTYKVTLYGTRFKGDLPGTYLIDDVGLSSNTNTRDLNIGCWEGQVLIQVSFTPSAGSPTGANASAVTIEVGPRYLNPPPSRTYILCGDDNTVCMDPSVNCPSCAIVWYTSAVGGSGTVGSCFSFNFTLPSTVLYVSYRDNCDDTNESTRTPVTVVKKPLPNNNIPPPDDVVHFCETGTNTVNTSVPENCNSCSYVWYHPITALTGVETSDPSYTASFTIPGTELGVAYKDECGETAKASITVVVEGIDVILGQPLSGAETFCQETGNTICIPKPDNCDDCELVWTNVVTGTSPKYTATGNEFCVTADYPTGTNVRYARFWSEHCDYYTPSSPWDITVFNVPENLQPPPPNLYVLCEDHNSYEVKVAEPVDCESCVANWYDTEIGSSIVNTGFSYPRNFTFSGLENGIYRFWVSYEDPCGNSTTRSPVFVIVLPGSSIQAFTEEGAIINGFGECTSNHFQLKYDSTAFVGAANQMFEQIKSTFTVSPTYYTDWQPDYTVPKWQWAPEPFVGQRWVCLEHIANPDTCNTYTATIHVEGAVTIPPNNTPLPGGVDCNTPPAKYAHVCKVPSGLPRPSGTDDGIASDYFTVYPNPAHNRLELSFNRSSATQVSVVVSNLVGNLIGKYDAGVNQQNMYINLEHYASGSYVASLFVDGKSAGRRSFAVVK